MTVADPSAPAADLADIIARAAPFPDRAEAVFFAPVPEAPDLESRVRRWMRTAAESPEAQRALMERLAASGRPLGAGLRTVRLLDPDKLPPWAEALTAFLDTQPEAADSGPPQTMLRSFERAARALLPRREGRIEGIEIADEGYRGIVDGLGRRLVEICDPALRFEAQLSPTPGDPLEWTTRSDIDATRTGWLRRLDRLPGLAFVLGVAVEQWRAGMIEILARLHADRHLISSELASGRDLGALVEIRAGAGDRHAGGRSVALLRFSSGVGVVYKPKDLRHVAATMDLIGFLDGAGLSLPLATRGVLCREGYGWEARIDPAPAEGRAGFARFYRRLGMLIRLMQLLNGRDLWADNLIAAGDQPILIDLECLFSPPLHPPPLLPPRRRALVDRLESTVIRTAMPIQAWLPSPECPARDLGCLSHAGDAGEGGLPIAPYRPFLGGEVADPWSHAEDVSAGYREMHELLVAQRAALLSPGGPLRGFAGARMRYIWRSTWDCHRALRMLSSPVALVDGAAREAMLALLLRGTHQASVDAGRPDLPEIASAEMDAFRLLDVPLFTSRTDSTSLFTPGGAEIEGHFAGTGWDEVHRRIAALGEVSLDDEIGILRSAIDAARGGVEIDLPSSATLHLPRDGGDPTAGEVLGAAEEIANLLLAARRPPLGAGSGFLALVWWPAPDIWEIAPAPADLVSGGLGAALFLAEHFASSGDPRAWAASRDTLDELFELTVSSEALPTDPRLALGAPVPGGLAGPGAIAYVAARLSSSLGDASLLAAAQRHVARAASLAEGERVSADMAFGLSGLALDLLRLRAGREDPDLDRVISSLVPRLAAALGDPATAALTERLADLVPIGRDAAALALARSMAVAPALIPDRAAMEAALSQHAFDLARRGGRLAALSAKGPRAGEIAARLGPADLTRLSTRALVWRAEEAQLAARVTGDPGAAREAGRCIRVLLDRRAATGKWFPDRLVDDRLNLSALDGVPALGLVLLRHLRPQLPLTSVLE